MITFKRRQGRWGAAAAVLALGGMLFGCNVDGRWGRTVLRRPAEPAQQTGTDERTADAVDLTVADQQEVDLVETVVSHREAYLAALRELQAFYEQHGYVRKARWAKTELDGLKTVQKFRYVLDAEVAAASLTPRDSIPEADALFQKGLDLMRSGGHGIPVLFRRDRMIEAAETFRELIRRYPTSDKIDDAAFYCGEIHKEYLPGQEEIAVKWYERAWTWNPDIEYPARFQAAVIYDYRLHDRDRALELYQAVLEHEHDKSNLRFAARRIRELSGADTGTGLAHP